MYESSSAPFHNLAQYPDNLLRIVADGVSVAVTYKKIWDDGFGARGWKLDASIGDPEIIASTRETGQRISTSVFIHDLLDHFLSGFGISGHRSEAMALIQLSKRTGSDPEPDYAQMINEDLFNGRVNGESLYDFLPERLIASIPDGVAKSNKAIMKYLRQQHGDAALRKTLVRHFFTTGNAGKAHALKSWQAVGLNPELQTAIGLALQKLLVKVDLQAEQGGIEKLAGFFIVNNKKVSFVANKNQDIGFQESSYEVAVV